MERICAYQSFTLGTEKKIQFPGLTDSIKKMFPWDYRLRNVEGENWTINE